jgi:hypothetical protein
MIFQAGIIKATSSICSTGQRHRRQTCAENQEDHSTLHIAHRLALEKKITACLERSL